MDELALTWNSSSGRAYRVETQSLSGTTWTPLEPDVTADTNRAAARIRIGEEPAESTGLYRVRLLP